MIINVDKSGTVSEFAQLLELTANDERVKSIMILACDENNFSSDQIDPLLKSVSKPVFGGIFPEIIHGQEKLSKGVIFAGLEKEANIYMIPQLSHQDVDYEEIIEATHPYPGSAKTMFVFVDGFAKRINALIDALFNEFGLEFNYIGGGAGSLSFQQKPCLFSNHGLLQDSALLAMVDIHSGIGVSHGWSEISGPYKVTHTDQNKIISLDWKPAFEVYREVVEKHSNKKFNNGNFFEIAKSYPFGINKLGTEKIVRDPLMAGKDNSLVCVGEIPTESYVHILNGNAETLVNAAHRALTLSEETYNGKSDYQSIFFMDCISRVLFLEDKFSREIEAVSKDSKPLIGALSIGEIANSGKDYLEFYNKTAVVGVLEN